MTSENTDRQNDEILVMESILGESYFKHELPTGEMKIDVKLPDTPLKLQVEGLSILLNQHQVSFLPPITLRFEFNDEYPSSKPPTVSLACPWLTKDQMEHLYVQLDSIWEVDKDEILYAWYSYLKDELLQELNITEVLLLKNTPSYLRQKKAADEASTSSPTFGKYSALEDVSSFDGGSLLPFLLTYNEEKKQLNFNEKFHDCQICFTSKSGADSFKFTGCDHITCSDCMKSYLEININDGNVSSLKCSAYKCESVPHEHQIKKLVNETTFEKYDRLLLKITLDTMDDIIYCPLKHCQSAVIKEADEKFLAQCPVCKYAFCLECEMSYHGKTFCNSEITTGMVELYMAGNKEVIERLNKRYGKEKLKQMVDGFAYVNRTYKWIKEHTKKCPKCNAQFQRISGCNKMFCTRCTTYFCYLCREILYNSNTYDHFGNGCPVNS